MGPLEYLVVAFPGNRFKGEIIPALREAVDKGIIRIVDMVLVQKDAEGKVAEIELEEFDQPEAGAFRALGEVEGLFSDEDLHKVAEELENNSTAGLLLFEHVWATRFRDAVLEAGGVLVANERIPKAVVDEALAWQAEPVGRGT